MSAYDITSQYKSVTEPHINGGYDGAQCDIREYRTQRNF